MVSLRGLNVKDVLEKIIKKWVIAFGRNDIIEGEYFCSNCSSIIDNNNCFIFVKDGYKIYYCKDCEISNNPHETSGLPATFFWYC